MRLVAPRADPLETIAWTGGGTFDIVISTAADCGASDGNFVAALGAFTLAAIVGVISAIYNQVDGETIMEFVAGSAMGAVGAFTFAIWRWKERELDPDAGLSNHAADGAIRIMMGALAGLMVMFLIHSNLDLKVVSFSAGKPSTAATSAGQAGAFCR